MRRQRKQTEFQCGGCGEFLPSAGFCNDTHKALAHKLKAEEDKHAKNVVLHFSTKALKQNDWTINHALVGFTEVLRREHETTRAQRANRREREANTVVSTVAATADRGVRAESPLERAFRLETERQRNALDRLMGIREADPVVAPPTPAVPGDDGVLTRERIQQTLNNMMQVPTAEPFTWRTDWIQRIEPAEPVQPVAPAATPFIEVDTSDWDLDEE